MADGDISSRDEAQSLAGVRADRYRRNGKQVIADNLHFADARDEAAAADIVRTMNLFDATRSIEPRRDCRPRGCGPCTCPDGLCGTEPTIDEMIAAGRLPPRQGLAPPTCGTCHEPIQYNRVLGTTCGCAEGRS